MPSTISYLEAGGARLLSEEQKLLYSDGPLNYRPPGWTIIETPEARGSRAAFWSIFRYAIESGLDLLGFEDDIICSRNAVEFMAAFQVPDELAFVSFFDNITPAGTAPGIRTYEFQSTFNFWGCQAVKIPARCIPYFLRPEIGLITPKSKDGKIHGRDIVMQHYLKFSPWPRWGTLFPHIVQHIGDVSVVQSPRAQRMAAEGQLRNSKNYAGDDFDALTLKMSSPV